MLMRAVANFAGAHLSMSVGDVTDCRDQEIVDDLIRAGYVETVDAPSPTPASRVTRKKSAKPKKNDPEV